MNLYRKTALAVATLPLIVCDSNDGPEAAPPVAAPTFNLQLLHASPDAPAVNVVFNGSEVLGGVGQEASSGRARLNEGTYPVQVDGILTDRPASVIGPVDVSFSADPIDTIAAVGTVSDMTLGPLRIAHPRTEVSAGSAWAFVPHAALQAPTVDLHVTVPGADLTATPKLGTFSFKETLGPAELTAGDDRIRVTPENVPAMELYDSGTVTLGYGDDLRLTAVAKTSTGFMSLAPGTYDITDTPAGSKQAAIGTATVTIEANGLYTAIAGDAAGGGAPLGLILLDDPLP